MSTNRAITTALTGFLEGRGERQAAQLKKARGDAELAKLDYMKSTGSMQQQIDFINQKYKELSDLMARQSTFRAFDAYVADSDPRHLNDTMKNDPILKAKFPDAGTLHKLDLENDKQIIAQAQNIPPGVFDDPITAKAASNRFLKALSPEGTVSILDMQKLYAGSGYTRQLNNRQIEVQLKKSKITKSSKTKQGSLERDAIVVAAAKERIIEAEAKGEEPATVDLEIVKSSKTELGSLERDATAVAAAKERIIEAEAKGEEPATVDLEIVKFGKKILAGVKPALLDEAEDRAAQLVKKFGGKDKFFKTDFSNAKNFRKAFSDVAAIESLEGIEWTTKEKVDLGNLRTLIALADPASKLSETDTGIFENTFHNIGKYLFDNLDGVAAVAAYAAFKNMIRLSMHGSAVTKMEANFNDEAYGTLKQRLGPVLQQFKISLLQVRAKLESVARMKNPYSAHVRLGVDAAKLNKIIDAIDVRVDMLDDSYATAMKAKRNKLRGGGIKSIGKRGMTRDYRR